MKATDLREKSVEDLRELAKTLARDVFQNRLKNFTNRLDDTSVIRKTKRELARVTTLLREVELGIRKSSPAAEKAAPAAKAAAAEPAATAKPKKSAPKKAASTETKSSKGAKKSEAKQS